MKIISGSEFAEVKNNKKVVIDFFATWCGPCKMLAPVLEELSKEMSDVEFYKVDVDESADIAKEYGIMSIPTLVLLENGEKKDMLVGFKPKEAIVEFIGK